jgi:hypothetical protein
VVQGKAPSCSRVARLRGGVRGRRIMLAWLVLDARTRQTEEEFEALARCYMLGTEHVRCIHSSCWPTTVHVTA